MDRANFTAHATFEVENHDTCRLTRSSTFKKNFPTEDSKMSSPTDPIRKKWKEKESHSHWTSTMSMFAYPLCGQTRATFLWDVRLEQANLFCILWLRYANYEIQVRIGRIEFESIVFVLSLWHAADLCVPFPMTFHYFYTFVRKKANPFSCARKMSRELSPEENGPKKAGIPRALKPSP